MVYAFLNIRTKKELSSDKDARWIGQGTVFTKLEYDPMVGSIMWNGNCPKSRIALGIDTVKPEVHILSALKK
jgi:hypothetical protein